jgi:general secretion pathway protein D
MDVTMKNDTRQFLRLVLCALLMLSALGTTPAQVTQPPVTKPKEANAKPQGGVRNQKPPEAEKNRIGNGLRVVPVQQTPSAQPAPSGQPNQNGAAPAIQNEGNTPADSFRRRGRSRFAGFSGGRTITMDFRGTDIGNVLKFFAMAANWQVVPDPGLTGPVTIISPYELTLDQAFQVLQSTLEVRGFTGQIEKRGETTVLKIVPLDRAVQSTSLLQDGGTRLSVDDLKNQVITQVIPVENVDANVLARELAPLINKGASLVGSEGTNALIVTDTASNVQRIGELVRMLDKTASNSEIRMFPLRYANANDVAEVINSLFRQIYTRGRASAQGGGQPGQPGGQPGGLPGAVVPPQPGGRGGPSQAQQERGAIIAVPDTRTNSVFVAASPENMRRVEEEVIKKMDSADATALQTRIIKLRYADATEVANTINTILSGSVPQQPRGTEGASFRQRVFGSSGFGQGITDQPMVASTDPFAKVVANARTNSLIVTATEERMKVIEGLIAELDVEVPVESTTFVIPLKNAQAEDVAYVLSQAFGTGQAFGMQSPFGGFFFNPFAQQQRRTQRQPIQRRQGQQQRNNPFGRGASLTLPGGRAAMEPENGIVMPNGVHGTLTPVGFIPDGESEEEDPSSRQFTFGGRGQVGTQRQGTPQQGRGQRGNFVNFLQLLQNVGVVADPASNSLIITTTPDNLEALKQIIASLDIVPRQVMIEVIIAEASLDTAQKLGFQFDAKGIGKFLGTEINQSGSSNFPLGSAGSTTGNITNPINPGAQYGIQAVNGKFNALLQVLATDNRVRILSTPKVFTSNNQQAVIEITTDIPYVTSSFTGGFNIGSNVNYDFLPVGVQLNVTPRITNEGLVTIDVVATASELLGFDTLTSVVDAEGRTTNIQAPRTAVRTTDTSVTVKSGEIVALGGLMRESSTFTTNKIPILGDLPLIGSLFRNTSKTTNKTELMIFMVPHVVDGAEQSKAVTQEQSQRIRRLFPELGKQHPDLAPPKPGERSAKPTPQLAPEKEEPTP